MEFSSYRRELSSKTTLSMTLLSFFFFFLVSKVFPANGLLDDDNTSIFHVSEMQIGLNEFDHGILGLLKQAKPKKIKPEGGFEP